MAESVNVFTPDIHVEIRKLMESKRFMLNLYDLGRQSYEPDFMASEEWVQRVKAALAIGYFEITGGLQYFPEELAALDDDVEVIIRTKGRFDSLVSVITAKNMIQGIVDRQQSRKFECDEVACILGNNISSEDISDAFFDGKLKFFRNGLELKPERASINLGYGEYTNSDEIDNWLNESGSDLVFPCSRSKVLTWEDLFINSPQRTSMVFSQAKEAVTSYLKQREVLPSRDQLWNFIENKEPYTDLAKDRESFRKNFERWTKKMDVKG